MNEDVTLRTVISRCLRLRCPSCGSDKLFFGLLRVKDRCGACGFNCRPEGGYYLGAIYINYGVTAIVSLGAGFGVARAYGLMPGVVVGSIVAIAVGLAFFQLSRSLWLGIGFWFGWHPSGR
jgi:uncharacterized protein (DUF983 family)